MWYHQTSCLHLLQVETAMISNLRGIMAQAVSAYATSPRKQWVLEWPGQAVLAVSGIYWTQQVRPVAHPQAVTESPLHVTIIRTTHNCILRPALAAQLLPAVSIVAIWTV